MTRAEHMTWCKERALAYCDDGSTPGAFSSMLSDLEKHPETAGHVGMQLGMMLMVTGRLKSVGQMRDFISGFN